MGLGPENKEVWADLAKTYLKEKKGKLVYKRVDLGRS